MKKQVAKRAKRVTRTFATEAEEAQWWFDNRGRHGEHLLASVKRGEAQILTKDATGAVGGLQSKEGSRSSGVVTDSRR